MKILAAQINPLVGDLAGNTHKVLSVLKRAQKDDVDLVVFSELALCGYPPEDLLLRQEFLEGVESHLQRVVQASKELVVVVGTLRQNKEGKGLPLFNSAAIIQDRVLLGFQDKCLLPNYNVFNERRYFEPGGSIAPWELFGKKVGILICEDMWPHAGFKYSADYDRDPVLELKKYEIDLLLNLSASPYHFQKPKERFSVCAKAAQSLNSPAVMCCQVGANSELIFDGYSFAVDKKGEIKTLAPGFKEADLLIDTDKEPGTLMHHFDEHEDLLNALTLGLKDYFLKNGFSKACLGVSGGIDSALVAYIAARALGKDNVLAVMLPSKFSTKESFEDATQLISNLSIKKLNLSIKEPYEAFLELLNPVFTRSSFDVTEENIQARIRSLILMALSNKEGHILLSTSNKSELAIGYSTLYGDASGALAVIGDLLKSKVFSLCHYINQKERQEVIPSSILTKPPSAELRPNQKDTDSLPDYSILDRILEEYIENYHSIDEIALKHGFSRELVFDIVEKIYSAEYKRRQGPPVLRVSQKAFGCGRRYPIVQGWC